ATLGRHAPDEHETDASSADRFEARKSETVARFVEAWESGNFEGLVSMLTEDAVMNMPPWVYWLDGREAVIQTMLSRGTWEGEPRSGRYRLLPTPMNGQPAGLAYVNRGDGRWVAVCLTVLTLDDDGRIAAMDVFVLPKHFETWGYPSLLL